MILYKPINTFFKGNSRDLRRRKESGYFSLIMERRIRENRATHLARLSEGRAKCVARLGLFVGKLRRICRLWVCIVQAFLSPSCLHIYQT